ncbi:NAD(P)H-dependent glycerol-3-phosphate dehydrogenase [Thioalkalivibrio sp. HK1]|uniref:NAD(P)H-dependent glycerol-3-phosphate dehydrogenase n=1 Tax=Thioalkalivibrio sp. HK1 TaxID=1469245 RepID=UPI00046F4FD9|nr:NAD(P)H-dependent glycerol-3-phosphate dehydrogenase [Thioalkalivibrio sp. HK1]
MPRQFDIAVIGAGSWGTALACSLVRNGSSVVLWGRDPALMEAMVTERSNERYLPGHRLPDALAFEVDFEKAVSSCLGILLAVPSHAFAERCALLRSALGEASLPTAGVLWAGKGFDVTGGRLLHEVAREILPSNLPFGLLSGPTFAKEVAQGLPGAAALASSQESFVDWWAERLSGPRFRIYTGSDLIGIQIAGAVKNVLAIAAGISDGLGFGANARAALIARGLREMSRLGEAAGGSAQTFTGLAGLGDLVLTCTDDQSRNRRFGLALAQGSGAAALTSEHRGLDGQVIEGIAASSLTSRLAQDLGVEMPICEQVRAVVAGEIEPFDAVQALLARDRERASATGA